MERRFVPDSEQRLVILYALHLLGPVTSMQLLQFLVEEDLMNYFDMQLNLCELEEQGQLAETTHPLGTLLSVNEKGMFTLDSFGNRIPASRRELIDDHARQWRRRFRMEQQTLADSFPREDGCLCVRLRLLEGNAPLLDMLITLPGVDHIPCLTARWHAAAPAVYAALTESLSAGYLEIDLPEDLPQGASLKQVGEDSWLLSLAGQAGDISATTLMTLPDETMARHYAYCWPTAAPALLQLIRTQLETQTNPTA